MPKIFISFFNAVYDPAAPHAMPCFYESFIKELADRGNTLLVLHHRRFSQNFGRLPQVLKNKIAEFSPDFAIIFNNAFYDLSEDFDFPIYIYEVDSVIYYSNIDILKKKKERFKYIVPQISSIDAIHDYIGVDKKNILHVPFFSSVRREDLPKTMNISFIGTRFVPCGSDGKTAWNRFMYSKPSSDAIKTFKKALKTVQLHPYITQQELVSKFQSGDFDASNFLNTDELISTISGSIRILTLSEISDLGLTIFGPESWYKENSIDCNIPLSYNRRVVYSLKHNQDIYNSSRLAINVNHVQAMTGFSWRVCDIMASDACLVSEYKPDFERYFPNVPIPLFTSRYEARSLCLKLLNNENMRRDIVEKCNEAIDKQFRFENMLPVLEDFLGISLKESNGSEGERTIEALETSTDRTFPRGTSSAAQKWELKKRGKLFFYLTVLILAQIPGFDLLLSESRRNKLLKKINKYWR